MLHSTPNDKDSGSIDNVDRARRCFFKKSTKFLACVGAACAVTPLLSSLRPNPSTFVEIQPIKVDLKPLAPGQQMIVSWQDQPVLIVRRTREMLDSLEKNRSHLRDPDSHVEQQPQYARNALRSLHPEYIVLVGLCTHLGCSPRFEPVSAEPNWSGGWVCPCHGSRFDLAGRVFKAVPAPINMLVPEYHFISDHEIIIGESI